MNFCTLFDYNFLPQGMALHASLSEHCPEFHLYIVAFDDNCLRALNKLDLKHVTVISLSRFEDAELLRIKPTRSPGEYCWTCTPSVIRFCLKEFNLAECTYIDADLRFFNDPAAIIQEMYNKGGSVLITDHNYSPQYDQSVASGRFCVQFMTFVNNEKGLEVLNWWRSACIDWCYARYEDGKFGDQKYLDDWQERFDCVIISSCPGAGLAPWNLQSFKIKTFRGGSPDILYSTEDGSLHRLYFFHFHGFRLYADRIKFALGYSIRKEFIRAIYVPYAHLIQRIIHRLEKEGESLKFPAGDLTITKETDKIFMLIKDVARAVKHVLTNKTFDFSRFAFFFNSHHVYKKK